MMSSPNSFPKSTFSYYPLNIAIVFFQLGLGGIQRKIIDLIDIMTNDNRVNAINLILKTEEKFNYLQKLNKTKLNIHIKESSIYKSTRYPFWLYINLKLLQTNTHSVLSFLDYCSLSSILYTKIPLRTRAIKLVICEDGLTSSYTQYHNDPLYMSLIGNYYSSADHIICPSHAIQHELTNTYHVNPNKLIYIPNWANVNNPSTRPPSQYDFIFAGRLEPQKNVSYIIRALKSITHRFPHSKLAIIGNGSCQTSLIQLTHKLNLSNNIKFITATHNIHQFILKSKIMLLSSHYEGMPLVALESQALKTPVISTNFPGVEDFINHKKDGYICQNMNDFVSYSCDFLASPKLLHQFANKAQAKASKQFSIFNGYHYVDLLTRL